MLNDEVAKINESEKVEQVNNELVAVDTNTASLPIEREQRQIVNQIIAAPDRKELERQFELFNVSQSKKNALRVIKLNKLLDKIEDQAVERFEKRPDQISNKELLEYMQVVSTQIDRSQKYIDSLKDTPAIKEINQTKNEVNINIGTELGRDSKEKVIDVIQAILKQAKASAENDVIDIGEIVPDDTSNNDIPIVETEDIQIAESEKTEDPAVNNVYIDVDDSSEII